MDLQLDENGKILNDDPIYDKLDKLEDDENYEGMINLISDIPDENRSLKLRFALISALINKGDYPKTVNELRRTYPECKGRFDAAQLFYYSGYAVATLHGNKILGLSLLKDALAADPKNELGLDIEDECRQCAAEIDEQLSEFGALCRTAVHDISRLCGEADGTTVYEGRELISRIAFPRVFRTAPGIPAPLSLENYAEIPDGVDKAKLADWLKVIVGVTDLDSITKIFQSGRSYNIARMMNDVTAFINGKPKFDIDALDPQSRSAFNTYLMFVQQFAGLLPKEEALAWDISKRIAVLRFAFLAEIISADDYEKLLDELTDSIRQFTDAEEFLISFVLGGALAAFDAESANLSAAFRSIGITMSELPGSGLAGSTWII